MKGHIAFLIMNMSGKGGTERVTSIIANGLSNSDYKVTIISCNNGKNSNFKLDDKVGLFSLEGEKFSNPILRKLHTYNALKQFVINNSVDVVVAVDVALYIYVYPLQLMKKCKGIAWEHFNYFITPSRLIKYSKNLAAKKADCLVVLGKNDYSNYKKNIKKIKRIEYIYNPCALDFSSVCDVSAKRVIAMGRLVSQKGFDRLVDAWSLIESDFPEWTLDIYGDGELKDSLNSRIKQYGLSNINLCGYTNSVDKEFQKSSIFVLSSRFEGFVLVLIEAMAKCLPCVSFNCKEGPAELIDNGINGYLVEDGNIEALADSMKKLMNSEALRKEFSENCRKNLDRFNPNDSVESWRKLLDSLLN